MIEIFFNKRMNNILKKEIKNLELKTSIQYETKERRKFEISRK